DTGEKHGTRSGRGYVSRRRPGMQRPNTSKYGEAEKHHRKRPVLEPWIETKSTQLIEIERACGHIRREDAEEYQRTAKEGVQRQLHRAVFLVGRTPDRDQEVF